MKKKELKRLAERLAALEIIIQENTDSATVKQAKNEIMELSGKIIDPEEMFEIDEIIQSILAKQQS